VIVRQPGDGSAPAAGAPVMLHAELADLHLFDGTSGRRIDQA
jgi:hypothetical protein